MEKVVGAAVNIRSKADRRDRLSAPRAQSLTVFFVLFALFLLRCCALGATYFPQLDDYIQYHNYAMDRSFPQLVREVGLLASRPLAGIADYFFWTPMFSRMILGVALLSALYAGYVLCAARLLRRYFAVGHVFFAVACFLPLGLEGLYWVSAASRIVTGLFFGVLAARAFARWLDTGGWGYAALYVPLQLLPFGFYEQSAILSMTLVLGMALLEWKNHRRRTLAALWAFGALALYALLLRGMAGSGVYASRAELALPNTPYYWQSFLPEIVRQIGSVFLKGGCLTLVKGFRRGLPIALAHLPWLIAAAAGCAALAWAALRRRADTAGGGDAVAGPLPTFFAGALLALAPVTIFFFLANPWFTVRGAAPSLLGIGLMADALAQWLLPRRRRVHAVLAGVLTLVFLVAPLSELQDYRDTYEADQTAARVILDALADAPADAEIGVLGLEPTYLPDQNYYYHGHITGCTGATWSFSGLLTAVHGSRDHPEVTPLPSAPMYRAWNAEVTRPENFDLFYYYDGQSLRPVTLERTGAHSYSVYETDGALLGRIWEDADATGHFALVAAEGHAKEAVS